MDAYAELIKSELKSAIINRDEEAMDRLSIILGEKLEEVEKVKDENKEIQGDIRELIGVVKKGFEEQCQRIIELREDMNKRFEIMDKRFEEQNQRIIELREDMNKRIAELREDMNHRFEDMNKRFEDMNKRFEDMHKKFSLMLAFITIGYTIMTVLIVVFKFLE